MNYKILQKCVDALRTEKPDISYVLGMLETLLELVDKPQIYSGLPKTTSTHGVAGDMQKMDEAEILNEQARLRLPEIQAMAKLG